MSDKLARLSELGVSIWLDDLSRERLEGGGAWHSPTGLLRWR